MTESKTAELASYLKVQQLHAVRSLRQASKVYPRLAILTNDANQGVVRSLQRAAEEVAIEVEVHEVTTKHVTEQLARCEDNVAIHGIVLLGIDGKVSDAKDVCAATTAFDDPKSLARRWLEVAYANLDKAPSLTLEDPLVQVALLENLLQCCRHTALR